MTFQPYHYRWRPERIREHTQTALRPLRPWQREALIAALQTPSRQIIRAVMGAGKSYVIACLAAAWDGPVVVSVPSIRLVLQTVADMRASGLSDVGEWYGLGRIKARIVVACSDSLPHLTPRKGQLMIVDECHRMPRELDPHLNGSIHTVGFSATPYRADDKGLRWWQGEAYAYGPDRALADGVLCPPRIIMPAKSGGLDAWCIARIAGSEGPGVVSCYGIADADEFAARLTEAGIPSASVHSQMSGARQGALIDDLHAGRLRALTHVRLLTEGVDLPWLRWLCLRREQDSRVEFAQMAGRGLRRAPGKTECVMYDPHQLFTRHDLGGVAEILTAAEDPATKKGAKVERVTDPLTGLDIDWSAIDATERRRIRALEASWSYVTQAVLALRLAGHLRRDDGPRDDPATMAQAVNLRRHLGFARVIVQQGGALDGLVHPLAPHARAIGLAHCRAAARLEQGAPLRRGPVSDILALLLIVRHKRHDLIQSIHDAHIDAGAP